VTSAAPAKAVAASSPCRSSPARRPSRAAVSQVAATRTCTTADSSAQRRSRWAWPRLERRSSRPATPSSIAAAWSVQAISSATLRRNTSAVRGRTATTMTTATSGNSGQAGHQVSPATTHIGPERSSVRARSQPIRRSSTPSSWVSSSIRSRTSPTAVSDSTASGWCIAADSRSARSRPSARSTTADHAVRPAVSSTAAPIRHSASSRTSPAVGPPATRPATTVPPVSPRAATAAATSAQAVTAPRTRRHPSSRASSCGTVSRVPGVLPGRKSVTVIAARRYALPGAPVTRFAPSL